jgi:hypothetical protein
MRTVTLVIEKIEKAGLFPPIRPLPFDIPSANQAPTDNRSKLVKEMLETERSYIASLEKLLVLLIPL